MKPDYQQLKASAFAALNLGLAILDGEGRLTTYNEKFAQLARHIKGLADDEEPTELPFEPSVAADLKARLADADACQLALTVDYKGCLTDNVFAGDTYQLRAQRLPGAEGAPAATLLCLEEATELARKGLLLDEFMVHRGLILDNTFSGLVYLTPDYEVLWKRLVNLWDNQLDCRYQEGTRCYESYGRTEPCGDCPILRSKKTGGVAKELRTMDDGTFIESTVIPVKKEGSIEGYILHLSDVTERETMIEALKLAKDNVAESERLEEAFINNMNHEIRTPLNAIIGFNDILNGVAGEHMEEEEKRLMKAHINKNADRLITLINDILDLSKMETGKLRVRKTVCSLREICYNAREAVKGQVQPGVELRHEFPTALVDTKLYTDGKRLEQLLRNVLQNACKHTSEGSVTLSVRVYQGDGGQDRLELAVTDTGVGIPHDKRHELFTPFMKVNGASQGLGTGLAICKQIAKMLDGHIYLDHLYTRGSRFVFEMPMETMP